MIFNVYKPKGWTSFDVVAKIRKLSGVKKVGHGGTLDPLAEGVLVVLTEKDTKIQDTFKELPKNYYFEFAIGVTTSSLDMEFTPVVSMSVAPETIMAKMPEIIDKFTGEFDQTAPLFSAKKVGGKRLYEIARAAEKLIEPSISSVTRPTKRITIYELVFDGFDNIELPTVEGLLTFPLIKMHVHCSSGTYVRQIAQDIAAELGSEAVVTKLIRTQIGNYKIEDSAKIEDLIF